MLSYNESSIDHCSVYVLRFPCVSPTMIKDIKVTVNNIQKFTSGALPMFVTVLKIKVNWRLTIQGQLPKECSDFHIY